MLPSEPEIAIDNLSIEGSEMADLMRAHNWSQTSLGEPSGWSSSLKTVLSILLSSPHPIFLWWGAELIQFYNDASRPILGTTKHPQALGQPGRECWQEIWDVIEPTIEAVMQRGEATRIQDGLLMLERNGYLEECYFNYAYSPVRNEAGAVGGVLCVCDETTKRVVGERQLKTLRELAAPVETKIEAACQLCMSALSQNPADIPFALLYTIDDLGESGRLMGTAGIAPGTIASPEQIDLPTHPWNLYQAQHTAQAQYITDLTTRFEVLPASIWNVPPQSAIVLPLARSGQQQIADFLILAVSPHRAFDDDYRSFFEVVANQVATAIANARAREEERKQAEALAALDRAKTELFSNVSHEFRTPLTLMLSPLADTLANLDGSLPPQERERLQLVQHNGNRLLKLVNSLDNRGGLQQQADDTARANLDRIVSSFRDGFATFDRQWRYTYINDRLLKFLDRPREAVIGQYSWDVFPHQVGIDFYARLNRAMNEQVEEQFEFYYSVADCWVEHRIYPTTDGVAMLMADISDRKRAQLLLVEQKRLMELTAAGEPLDVCLAAVCASVSNLSLGVRACILPTDAQRQQFPRSISSEFPPSFVLGLENMPLDELEIGICAPAVYSGRSVTCADIVNDELQSPSWRDLCAANGILACHCAPILGADDVPLGSLMLCFDRPRVPTQWEYQLAEFGTQIASIVFERDRSSLALRESEAKYRTLFESMDEGLCICEMLFDENGVPEDYRFLEVNSIFGSLTGLVDATGKTIRQLTPDLEAEWFEIYGRVVQTGEPVRFENQSIALNRWFDVNAFPIGEPHSKQFAVLFTNTTERKQIEQALCDSEEQSRNILESISDAFFAIDDNWLFTYMNGAAATLLDRTPGDLIGKNIWAEYPGLLGSNFEPLYKGSAQRRVADTLTAFYPDHDRWYEVRTYPAATGMSVYFRNVTDLKQAEEALRESEERFRNMADNAPMMVWVTDPTGYCTYLSRSWYEFSGQSESDGLGFGWLGATHPNDLEFARNIFLRANERHESFQLEYRLLRQDGEYRTCIDVGCPWFDADGEFRGFIGSVIDIDERKQMETTLAERARELANLNTLLAQAATLLDERNQELDRFVHVVAHDLKAPLRAIANLSEWIEEDLEGSLTPDTQQQMDRLRGRVRLMESTISGLLDYARAGRTDATVETVSVAKLLAETIDSLAPPPTFEITVAPGMPTLQTKRLLLSQVFANLIGNAFKHHDRLDGSIRISSRQQGDFYEFAIADDGPGIAPADRDRVFVIFQAANPQKNPDSSGIGLAIVKKIVETAGGTIRLESELGRGTTFYFTWPEDRS